MDKGSWVFDSDIRGPISLCRARTLALIHSLSDSVFGIFLFSLPLSPSFSLPPDFTLSFSLISVSPVSVSVQRCVGLRICFGLKFPFRAAVDSFCGIGQTQLMIKDESRITTFVEFLICGNIMRVCLSNDALLNTVYFHNAGIQRAHLLLLHFCCWIGTAHVLNLQLTLWTKTGSLNLGPLPWMTSDRIASKGSRKVSSAVRLSSSSHTHFVYKG